MQVEKFLVLDFASYAFTWLDAKTAVNKNNFFC